MSFEPPQSVGDGKPELPVGDAPGLSQTARDFVAGEPGRFEMQHVFAFGPIESALVAVGHKRESFALESDDDRQLALVFATPVPHDVSGRQPCVFRHVRFT
jgi:hypothetical protein